MTYWDYVYVQFKQLEFTLPALLLLIGIIGVLEIKQRSYISLPFLITLTLLAPFIRALIGYKTHE
jgi:hypothetical protein